MTIVRYERGTPAPRDAQYAVVGHYGEPTGVIVWRGFGEALPSPEADGKVATPLWFVELEEAVSELAAA